MNAWDYIDKTKLTIWLVVVFAMCALISMVTDREVIVFGAPILFSVIAYFLYVFGAFDKEDPQKRP